jgi:hypothetical protein
MLLRNLPAVSNVHFEGTEGSTASFAVAAAQASHVIAQLRRTGTLEGSETGNITTGEMTLRFRSISLPTLSWPAMPAATPSIPATAARTGAAPMAAPRTGARAVAATSQQMHPREHLPRQATAAPHPPIPASRAPTQDRTPPPDLRPRVRAAARPPRAGEPLHVAAERIRFGLAAVQRDREVWRQALDAVVEQLDEQTDRTRPQPRVQPRPGSLRDAFPRFGAVPGPHPGSG